MTVLIIPKQTNVSRIKSPLPLALYIKASHLFKPSESFLMYDLLPYGLEL